MSTIVLENTPFACRLLEPVDVIINWLTDDPIDKVQQLDPTQVNSAQFDLNDLIPGTSHNWLSVRLHTDRKIAIYRRSRIGAMETTTTIKNPSSFESDAFRDELVAELRELLPEFDSGSDEWHDVVTKFNQSLKDDYVVYPLHAIERLFTLSDKGWLKVVNEDAFFNELMRILPFINERHLRYQSKLFDFITSQASAFFKTHHRQQGRPLFLRWLQRKPIDLIVTLSFDHNDRPRPVYRADTNESTGLLIAKHLLINEQTTIIIDAKSSIYLTSKSKISGLLHYPEILSITQKPMSHRDAELINTQLARSWSNSIHRDSPYPEYAKAISDVL